MPLMRTALSIFAAAVVLASVATSAVAEDTPPILGGAVATDAARDTVNAPDIRTVTPFSDAEGRFGLRLSLGTNAMASGGLIYSVIDVDGDPTTGWTVGSAMGADASISISAGSDGLHVALTRINPDGRSHPAASATLETFRSGATDVVWRMSATELGVAGRTEMTFKISSMDTTTHVGVDEDVAPDRGSTETSYTRTIGFVSAPWPPVSAAVPPVPWTPPTSTPRPPPVRPSLQRPPRQKRFSLQGFGLFGAPRGIQLVTAWTGGAGRVRWTLRLDGRRDGRRLQFVARGSGVTSPVSTVTRRTVVLPSGWGGVAFRATYTVADTTRSLRRARLVRFPR